MQFPPVEHELALETQLFWLVGSTENPMTQLVQVVALVVVQVAHG